MKKQRLLYLIIIVLLGSIVLAVDLNDSHREGMEDFALAEMPDNNQENFDKMMDVLTHPRCTNCHPSNNLPKQGEDSHPHYFGVARGTENIGFAATKCTTCHQVENNDYSGVPGAPEWSLAPESMKWEGLSRIEIAESMLDRKRNGGRSHEEVMEHLTEHELVLWAWDPGVNVNGTPREKPPVPKEEYIEIVRKWFEDGAVIPE